MSKKDEPELFEYKKPNGTIMKVNEDSRATAEALGWVEVKPKKGAKG